MKANVPFTTTWVDILDIPEVRKALGCPAVRQLDDPASGAVVGDSFDIAEYLDAAFPDSGSGRLFPLDSSGTGLDYDSPHGGAAFAVPLTLARRGSAHEAYARCGSIGSVRLLMARRRGGAVNADVW